MNSIPARWAVIWDMDGVLIDSEEAHFAAWSRLFQEEGIPYHRDLFLSTFGQRNDAVIRHLLGPSITAEQIRAYDQRKEAYFRAMIPTLVKPLPGALALLAQLAREGALQAIGSSGPRDNVLAVVEHLGVRAYFGAIVSGNDVQHGKPAPDTFLTAAQRLDVSPARCVVLEDAPQGIAAAKNAGMHCVAITSTRTAAALAQAQWVVDHLTQVDAKLLRQIALSDHID